MRRGLPNRVASLVVPGYPDLSGQDVPRVMIKEWKPLKSDRAPRRDLKGIKAKQDAAMIYTILQTRPVEIYQMIRGLLPDKHWKLPYNPNAPAPMQPIALSNVPNMTNYLNSQRNPQEANNNLINENRRNAPAIVQQRPPAFDQSSGSSAFISPQPSRPASPPTLNSQRNPQEATNNLIVFNRQRGQTTLNFAPRRNPPRQARLPPDNTPRNPERNPQDATSNLLPRDTRVVKLLFGYTLPESEFMSREFIPKTSFPVMKIERKEAQYKPANEIKYNVIKGLFNKIDERTQTDNLGVCMYNTVIAFLYYSNRIRAEVDESSYKPNYKTDKKHNYALDYAFRLLSASDTKPISLYPVYYILEITDKDHFTSTDPKFFIERLLNSYRIYPKDVFVDHTGKINPADLKRDTNIVITNTKVDFEFQIGDYRCWAIIFLKTSGDPHSILAFPIKGNKENWAYISNSSYREHDLKFTVDSCQRKNNLKPYIIGYEKN